MMWARWVSAVRTERKRSSEISWLVWPRASRRRTSRSRSRERVVCGLPPSLGVGGDHAGAEGRVDIAPTRGYLPDSCDEVGVGSFLEDVPDAPAANASRT